METEQVFKPTKTFLHSVDEWCMLVSEDTEGWLTSPHFKQEGTCSLCLLCGKTVRGPQMNDSLVEKHVKGSHHKKTYQLMENLKKLKDEDAFRFDELINTVSAIEDLPTSNCTLKQLLAYYHNITIQGLQSKKPLEGIVKHFKRRFLSDKIQPEAGRKEKFTESKTPAKEVGELSCTEEKVMFAEPSQELNDADAGACGMDGNEENQFGMVFRSPLPTVKEWHQQQPIDTPFIGNQTKQADAAEAYDSLPVETSLLSVRDNHKKGVCESPSSDISQHSELQWLGKINELDDMLDNNHNMFDGSLDDYLQRMVEDDNVGGISLMGMPIMEEMPMMVVTSLDNMEGAYEFFETEIENFCQAASKMVEQPLETQKSDSTEPSTDCTPSRPESVPRALIKDTVEAADVLSERTNERHLEIKRSLECVAALAFFDV
eukprot:scaffold394_cov166-Amphora_coffeaeformis.AAC.10